MSETTNSPGVGAPRPLPPDSFASAMRPRTSEWTAIASMPRCGLSSRSFRSANRAWPLTDLSWTIGRISMSGPATDCPGRPKGDRKMGRKKRQASPGGSGVWHIDKRIRGRRISWPEHWNGSTPRSGAFLARLTEEIRQATVYGVRPSRTFEQAAAKFVLENQHKRSIGSDVGRLKTCCRSSVSYPLDRMHIGVCNRGLSSDEGSASERERSTTGSRSSAAS